MLQHPPVEYNISLEVVVEATQSLYLANPAVETARILADNCIVSAADCAFFDMVGSQTNFIYDSGVVFVGSTFTSNRVQKDEGAGNTGLVVGASTSSDTLVWLESCTFTNNTAEHMLVAEQRQSIRNVTFVSDTEQEVWLLEGDSIYSLGSTTLVLTKPLSEAPQTVLHLSANDPWLRKVQEVSASSFYHVTLLSVACSVHRCKQMKKNKKTI